MSARGLKIVFCLINVLLMMIGMVLVGLGIWVVSDGDGVLQLARLGYDGNYDEVSKAGLLEVASSIAIVEGSIMILLAVLAFCGVGQESKCFLALYAGILAVLILLQVVIIVLTSIMRVRVHDNLRQALKESIKTEYEGFTDSKKKFSLAMDRAQVLFSCCGVDSYNEFNATATNWKDRTSLKIPKTCCKLDREKYLDNTEFVFVNKTCARILNPKFSNIDKACHGDIQQWLDDRVVATLALTVVFAGIQIFGAIFACCIVRALRYK
ncbi:unnamed protein product [Lymnaea stagnalis]|uniref:Tetraspanin n=1 Tax=Lymnaea stagnalis TaxID=6523 RepID=A0AAV2I3D2_LYMST